MRVLVLTGAGVSAESGIPTFRAKNGYWRNLDPTKLATPEAFERDPKLVWEWYRERRHRIRNAQPNAAHEAIAELAQHAEEFLLVHKTWITSMPVRVCHQKRWCKFTATFLSRAVRAANLRKKVAAVHPKPPPGGQFNPKTSD